MADVRTILISKGYSFLPAANLIGKIIAETKREILMTISKAQSELRRLHQKLLKVRDSQVKEENGKWLSWEVQIVNAVSHIFPNTVRNIF